MRVLTHLLALCMGLVAALTLWGVLATGEIFSAQATESAASQTGLYSAIATQTPQLLLHVAPLTAAEEKALGGFVDAGLVENWAHGLLPQLDHYYRQGGTRPQLSLSAITMRAEAANVLLPTVLTSRLEQPVTISAGRLDKQLSEVIRWTAHMRVWGPLVLAVLALAGLFLVRRHWLLWLAESLLWGAIFSLAAWLALQLMPHLVTSTVANSTAAALSGAISSWLKQLFAAPSHNLVRGAGALIVSAVVLTLGQGIMHLTTRSRSKTER